AAAVGEGLIARSGKQRGADEKPEPGVVAADEPLAEWERELIEDTEKKADSESKVQEPATAAAE
ncbi:MAG TPA: 30S ribosomal protein S2, partial [Micromonospora sp.]